MIAGFTSTPMPGETLESAENGEIQNPYYNAGFENLADDLSETDEQEPTIPETEPQLMQTQQETQGNGYDSSTAPTEDANKPDNAITESFGQEWDKGNTMTSIRDQQQHIEQSYADGAINQANQYLHNTAQEAIRHANTDFEDNDERTAQEQENQEIKNIAEAITGQAMAANIEAQRASEAIALGDTEQDEHLAKLQEAQTNIEQLASAGYIAIQDAGSAEIATRARQAITEAQDISRTATEQVKQTRTNVEEAQREVQKEADRRAEKAGAAAERVDFTNLDDTLPQDQQDAIIDAMVADNYNAPEQYK